MLTLTIHSAVAFLAASTSTVAPASAGTTDMDMDTLYPKSASPTSHLQIFSDAGLDPAMLLALETLSGGARGR